MNNVMRKKQERGEKPENIRKTLKRLYWYLAEDRKLFFGLLVLLFFSIACEFLMPLIMESCIDAISFSNGIRVNTEKLLKNLIFLMLVAAVNAVMAFFQGKAEAKLSLGMEKKLRRDLFDKIVSLPVSTLDKQKTGDLMSRVTNDTELAAGAFSKTILSVISSVMIIAGCAVIMIGKCPIIAWISIGSALLSVLIAALFSGFIYPAFLQQQVSLGRLNSHIEESMKGFRTALESGGMPREIQKTTELSRDYYKKKMRSCVLENVVRPFMMLGEKLNFILVVVFGAQFTLKGVITIGALQAFLMYSRQFMEPVSELGENMVAVQNSLAGAERIFRILDTPSETDLPDRKEMPGGISELSFENISFAYHKNLPVLQNMSLKVEKGETLALVGRSGAGKTTLMNLLLRFYRNYSGSVFVDETDGKEIAAADLRSSVTYIAQDPQMIDGTILENVAYGMGEISESDVREAVEMVGLGDVVNSLPDGFHTVIRNGSETFSQGQQQLLCLARAVLRRSKIIILDEATSSVDMTTERLVKDSINRVICGKTCIVIAHRLSSVRDADHIAVLDNGKIVEYGTHSQLMDQKGSYYMLYQNQFFGKEV